MLRSTTYTTNWQLRRLKSPTYKRNWPDAYPVGDVQRIAAAQVPRHDVLAAGFPCQSFSNAGRLGRFDDHRGQLFFELVRIIRECRPRAILLENVRGLRTQELYVSLDDSLSVDGLRDLLRSLQPVLSFEFDEVDAAG